MAFLMLFPLAAPPLWITLTVAGCSVALFCVVVGELLERSR